MHLRAASSWSASIWLYTLIFTFSALWFTHYCLAVLAALRARRGGDARACSRRWRRRPTCSSSRKCRRTSASATTTPPTGRRRMNFGALIIGDEILSGRREDKHLARSHRRARVARPRAVVGALRRRRAGAHRRRDPRRGRLAATRCSRSAASAPRPTTTRASAPRRRWASRSRCIPRPRRSITQRGRDMAAREGPGLRHRPAPTTSAA